METTRTQCEVCGTMKVATPARRSFYCPFRTERSHKLAADARRLRLEVEKLERYMGERS